MEKVIKQPTKHITEQWVRKEHFEAFVRCSNVRPDLSVKVIELERDTNDLLVKARFVFTNIGRNLYTQRIFHFISTSLEEYKD
jgi:hypothetical protein